jgi:ABC-type branched-subunit amino acid transport system ATPase component
MLELKVLSKHFGGVKACDELDVVVKEGEIFGLIGPNGSGKSTTVNLVCGVFAPTAGQIEFNGDEISGLPPHRRISAGIARTFQNIRLFNDMPVWKNLWVAQNSIADATRQGFLRRWFGGAGTDREEIDALLEFAGLAGKGDDLAGSLAFGEQRRLELVRAVTAKPRLLLLDEPAAGMNAEEVGELGLRIMKLRDDGMTILLVEHVMELVMGVTDRITVLNFGRKIAEGTPEEVRNNPVVQEAYLGVPEKAA